MPDVAVVATDDGLAVPAAGVFTANLAAAAPVQVSRAHLAATAGPGRRGHPHVGQRQRGHRRAWPESPRLALCTSTALAVGASPEEILVCQTGLIGIPFPLETVHPHVRRIAEGRAGGPDAGAAAARAIMTTDTVEKVALARGNGITVGAMAKGAAMLAPNMATMLALCTTDAAVDPRHPPGRVAGRRRRVVQRHDRRRVHLDQRHRPGAGQRARRHALARAP